MKRREIWQADLGYTDEERAIVTYVPRTTNVWDQSRFDVPHRARGMKDGAFAVQLIGSIPRAKYLRRIGLVDQATFEEVEKSLSQWLGLSA